MEVLLAILANVDLKTDNVAVLDLRDGKSVFKLHELNHAGLDLLRSDKGRASKRGQQTVSKRGLSR